MVVVGERVGPGHRQSMLAHDNHRHHRRSSDLSTPTWSSKNPSGRVASQTFQRAQRAPDHCSRLRETLDSDLAHRPPVCYMAVGFTGRPALASLGALALFSRRELHPLNAFHTATNKSSRSNLMFALILFSDRKDQQPI